MPSSSDTRAILRTQAHERCLTIGMAIKLVVLALLLFVTTFAIIWHGQRLEAAGNSWNEKQM
jgi:hypothetical protein